MGCDFKRKPLFAVGQISVRNATPFPRIDASAIRSAFFNRSFARKWSSALEDAMAQPIVFFDIAGPDDAALEIFYSSIFGWEIDQSGRFDLPVATPFKGAIRNDPTEKRIYLGVPDVAASLSLIEQSGGTVDVPRFEVPGVVVLGLGLFRDPAGNPMGLVEMDGDSPRVP